MYNVNKNSYLVKLGARIRELRKEKKLSMESFAVDLDIEYRQLGRIERGEINTTILSLKKIADTLNVSLSSLLDFK